MAVCKYCKREMTTADGCIAIKFPRGVQPVPFGSESLYTVGWTKIPHGADRPPEPPPERCHDCGVKVGQYHHPGCDIEECPRCHWQAISCDCANE